MHAPHLTAIDYGQYISCAIYLWQKMIDLEIYSGIMPSTQGDNG
jgi:hypothetical protein